MNAPNHHPVLSASYLASLGVRFPLHTAGPATRNVHDADDDLIFIGPPRDGAAERAAAIVRMVNMQADRLRPSPSLASLDAGVVSPAGA